MDEHRYRVTVEWTGNRGGGTASYTGYSRDHTVTADGKPDLVASSDPHFRGDPSRHNPEDLLVASLSGCHMLWYLHLCSAEGVHVVSYVDHAEGRMTVGREGGRFAEVVLRPRVRVFDAAMNRAGNSAPSTGPSRLLHRRVGELPGAPCPRRLCHPRGPDRSRRGVAPWTTASSVGSTSLPSHRTMSASECQRPRNLRPVPLVRRRR